jgi:2-polyprenyl-6-methoxyphenol hydroxylase-like FAD-dependent oxidoreductase
MAKRYDAIVVGARCAGSPTAMLLAQRGHRVLLVDKATFPSDTLSTHIIHPPGVAALERWSLTKPLKSTGCPPFGRYAFDFGDFTIAGPLRPVDGTAYSLCPRRTVLDKLLVDAARRAGAEVVQGFAVDEILLDGDTATGIRGHRKGGVEATHRGSVVIGADGQHSLVAKAVRAERYNERPTISVGYYTYWTGLPTDCFEGYIRPRAAFAFAPTNDGLTLGVISWPRADFEKVSGDVEGHFLKEVEQVPALHARIRAAKRDTRWLGAADLPNFFRKPYGPGWVLIGDAGHHKDPITAQGISDAFRDAEAMADALHDVFTGRRPFDAALSRYQRERDEQALPKYELTCQFANLEEPPPPEMQQLLAAMPGNQEAMSDFLSTLAGIIPAPEFFAPENVERILAQAARSAPG